MSQQQRTTLFESAARMFYRGGYFATGAREIAAAAGVPQGSFTNYLRSKEALGAGAIYTYFARLRQTMKVSLQATDRSPAHRLDDYFDLIEGRLAASDWRVGCLIPDLAADVPVRSEVLRERLLAVMREQVGMFEAVLAEASNGLDAGDLGAFVVAAWHGTLLRLKCERGPDPLRRFRRVLRLVLERALSSGTVTYADEHRTGDRT